MDYVGILRFRPVSGVDRDAALARRAGWQYPAGLKVIAEYWPMAGDIQVVTGFSTDSAAAVMVGPEVFGRLTRLTS
jgi:hypothetical protein